jgi:hypothetical protein
MIQASCGAGVSPADFPISTHRKTRRRDAGATKIMKRGLGPGPHPREHSEDGANLGETKRCGSSKIGDTIWAEDHGRDENRIAMSDRE